MVKKTTASNKFHRKKLRRIIQDGVERSPPLQEDYCFISISKINSNNKKQENACLSC